MQVSVRESQPRPRFASDHEFLTMDYRAAETSRKGSRRKIPEHP